MKLALWTNSPSPHQRDFYDALRLAGVDLRVRYFGGLSKNRLGMGWHQPDSFPADELLLAPGQDPLETLPDFGSRVHILPGYAYPMSRYLVGKLSAQGVPWAHWSEASRRTWRSPILAPLQRWYARKVNRHALGAFAQGEMAAETFQRWGIRREAIAHLYYSVEHSQPDAPDQQTLAWLRGRNAVAFVAAMIPRKDPLTCLRAFAQARQNERQAMVMTGDGPLLDACRREAHALGIADGVLLLGSAPMARVPSILACCRTLVLPSLHDGWGMALNEGAAAGLALIASDRVGAARSLIQPGFNGCIHRAGDQASLCAAMSTYLADPELARLHGERSRNLLFEHTPQRNAERCLSGLRGWLGRSRRWEAWHAAWRAAQASPGQGGVAGSYVLKRAA